MFTVEFAQDFSGLTPYQIRNAEQKGLLRPLKQHGTRYYTLGDIYTLRTLNILRMLGLKSLAIDKACDYLQSISPDVPIGRHVLLHDSREVFTIVDQSCLNASQYGQLVLDQVLQLVPLGTELERVRQGVARYVKKINRASEKGSFRAISLSALDDLLAG